MQSVRRRFFELCLFSASLVLVFAASYDLEKDKEFLDQLVKALSPDRNLLEACERSEQCSARNENSYCTDGQCLCAPEYVMLGKNAEFGCFPIAKIGEKCSFDDQCQGANTKTTCVGGLCKCKASFKHHPECKIYVKSFTKHISMSYLINIVMATIVGVIVLLFIFCIICFKCQKGRTNLQRTRQVNNPSRQSVMSSNEVEKPPSYDEIYIGSPVPPIERPPTYNQVFVYGEVAVPGNYPTHTVLEDFPRR